MKIGMVCPYSFDEPGGVQAHILHCAAHFVAEGHDVVVLGPCSDATDVPDFVVKGGPSIPIPYNGSVARLSAGPQVDKKIKQFITDGDFDILHIHEPNSPSYSMWTLRLVEGPIVATYHASASKSKLLKFVLPALRPLLEKIRGGIAVSEMARRWQVEQLGGDPVLIPNGVETKAFAAARVTYPKLSHQSESAAVEIVFLGRLDEPRKGLDIVLSALDQIDPTLKVHCTVIGGGRPRQHKKCAFVGRVSDEEKAKILAQSDIFVAPNTGGESFGIVLVEAMAAGCAVVASDLEAFAAVTDQNSDNPAGVLFPVGDSTALAHTVEKLIASPKRREQLVDHGLKRAIRFDWDTVAAEIMRVYETVADGTKVHLA